MIFKQYNLHVKSKCPKQSLTFYGTFLISLRLLLKLAYSYIHLYGVEMLFNNQPDFESCIMSCLLSAKFSPLVWGCGLSPPSEGPLA